MSSIPVRAWPFPSSRGTTTYEVTLWDDGTLSCDCPGWVYAKKGRPRACKHTRIVEAWGPGDGERGWAAPTATTATRRAPDHAHTYDDAPSRRVTFDDE